MNLRAALARIFGMATIVAVLAFASSAAEAHGGHVHVGAAPIVLSLQAPLTTVSLEKLSAHTEFAEQNSAEHDHGIAELRTTPDSVPADTRTICLQSCCAGAPCHSSTACTLGPDLGFSLPGDAGIGVIVRNAPDIYGHNPEKLRKPPKTFA